jgi:biopolymer transport protein ExbB
MLELLVRGGWALWIIAGCSIIAMGIALERFLTLRQADVDSEELLGAVAGKVDQDDVAGALALCEAAPGPVAETMAIGLRQLAFLESVGKRPEEIEAGIVQAMEDHTGHVVDFLESNLSTLATISSLAPILGMMGTVVGMIKAFGLVGKSQNMSTQGIGGGISEALLCTAGGLIVAAVTTVEYNYFVGRVNRFVLKVQVAGTALVERVLHAHARARAQGRRVGVAAEAVPA